LVKQLGYLGGVIAAPARDLVLVGGGHAHVQVIRRWMLKRPPDARLTVVLDRPEAVYSGMVPGFVAGDHAAHELAIDVVPLARRAGARVILAAARRIDAAAQRIELEGRPPIRWDVASLDVGSSVRGLDLPGARELALATRPIGDFVARLEARLRDVAGPEPRIAVVGGGAAGLELAFCLRARLRAAGREPRVCIVCDAPDVLPGAAVRVVRRARREAARRGIEIACDVRVVAVEKGAVVLAGAGERVECDLAVLATGAAPPALVTESPLPRDAAGFVRVRETLQVVEHDDLFAAGDCAALEGAAWMPKAGVYAVREGPILDANLRARLSGRPLRRYRPQRDFLALLNLGEREALGFKWGRAVAGPAVWRQKDRIDRRFVARFRVLAEDGSDAPGFPAPEALGRQPMACGGCAGKLAAPSLTRALSRLPPAPPDDSVVLGLARPDDAALVRLPTGGVLLASVDAFRAFADDPWLVGRVAAVNAASDVFAKGGRPRHALALVTVPDEDARQGEETLYQVLAGVRAGLDALGISLVGGHTVQGGELAVGLAITGELGSAERVLSLAGARPGEVLVLSKPLGTGVVLAADHQGRARGAWVAAAHASMQRANAEAARLAGEFGASACTDVSGFGLAGHLAGLLRASGVSARIAASQLPAIDGALALFARGIRSTYHAQNAGLRSDLALAGVAEDSPALALCFDPQTSGGLLFALPAARAEAALRALREAGDERAAVIGEILPASGALIQVALNFRTFSPQENGSKVQPDSSRER
jgi:selenide,water dikinase